MGLVALYSFSKECSTSPSERLLMEIAILVDRDLSMGLGKEVPGKSNGPITSPCPAATVDQSRGVYLIPPGPMNLFSGLFVFGIQIFGSVSKHVDVSVIVKCKVQELLWPCGGSHYSEKKE